MFLRPPLPPSPPLTPHYPTGLLAVGAHLEGEAAETKPEASKKNLQDGNTGKRGQRGQAWGAAWPGRTSATQGHLSKGKKGWREPAQGPGENIWQKCVQAGRGQAAGQRLGTRKRRVAGGEAEASRPRGRGAVTPSKTNAITALQTGGDRAYTGHQGKGTQTARWRQDSGIPVGSRAEPAGWESAGMQA